MLVKLLGFTLSLALLGCLLLGCSDDTQRITSKGTTIVSDPFATSTDDSGSQTDLNDWSSYDLLDTATADDESDAYTTTDPSDRFTTGHESQKPIDVASDKR